MRRKLDILFFQTDFPYPLNSGGRLRTFHLLKELSKTNNISMISFADSSVTAADIHAMEQNCSDVVPIRFIRKHSIIRMVKSILTGTPYKVLQYSSAAFADAVCDLIGRKKFDVVFSEHPYLAQYIPGDAKCVITQKDEMMATIMKRTAKSGNFFMRLYARTQWRKMWNHETELFKRYRVFIAINREEQQLVSALIPGIKTAYIPNGVDSEYYAQGRAPRTDGTPDIVFTGVFSYYPNEQAALYFGDEILPRIRKQRPNARFIIVGKEPGRNVLRLGKKSEIMVTGYVEDVRPYLGNASVVVAPLLIGGGTRNKILEAFAMGKPVVSTSLGCEGLDVENGKHLLIADTPQEFAEAVLKLLDQPDLARRLGEQGRRLVETEYRWEAIGRRLDDFIHELVEEYTQNAIGGGLR